MGQRAKTINVITTIILIVFLIGCTKTNEEEEPEPEPTGIPEVTTSTISNITQIAASGGGEVTSEGDSEVTARGVCWNTETNPTLTNDHTTDGNGEGPFLSTITGLTPENTYYVRAYATNANGTAFGEQVSFSTVSNPEMPVVLTIEITNVNQTSATGGGTIISQGTSQIIARGVCWNTSPEPTFDDNHTLDGGGYGSYTSEITNLNQSTTYYLRAYARNLHGTGYGDEVSFITMEAGDPPTLITSTITNISSNSATGGGDITNQGSSAVNERGVCWSTSQDPSLDDDHTTDGPGSGLYSSQLEMLEGETTYYVRAYAINNSGTGYGNEVSFTTEVAGVTGEPCPGLPSVTYEGQEYNTVFIGGQCWLKENLNVGLKILDSENMTDNGVIEKYCFDDLDENCDIYGALYTWDEIMKYTNDPAAQGICPDGWHIPTDDDYNFTIGFLGSEFLAGGKMKSTGTIEAGTGLWFEPNAGATNESGFTAHPGGERFSQGGFHSLGEHSYFWTSTELSEYSAWYINIYYQWDDVSLLHTIKGPSYSVRCIRD
ncbi:MAG: hypothetical protein K8S16_17030 [Bacteroidales bacterium]|nr:hypothetical protein [Bacteroidales bacterium]